MPGRFSLDDYIDVAERIQHFKEAHPEGSLQTIDWSVAEIEGRHFIVYRAAAYRTPDDERPGHGIAWEPFPGPTAYTKDSELMNAETAAWGRAIVALGLAANRKIASRQEVRARTEPQQANGRGNGTAASPQKLSEATFQALKTAKDAAGKPEDWFRMQLVAVGAQNVPDGPVRAATIKSLTEPQATQLLTVLSAVVDSQVAS